MQLPDSRRQHENTCPVWLAALVVDALNNRESGVEGSMLARVGIQNAPGAIRAFRQLGQVVAGGGWLELDYAARVCSLLCGLAVGQGSAPRFSPCIRATADAGIRSNLNYCTWSAWCAAG